MPLSLVLLVDKPAGPTSFDIVRMARKGLGEKVGHAGTLDPFATGLLLILVGQATRISSLLMELPKEYEVVIQFGAISSTADPTGDIRQTGQRVEGSQVLAALEGFRGKITQRVPMTSAVKVGGEALYRKAHRGEVVETPERQVMIHELTMLDFNDLAQTALLRTVTSSGTYVRSLAEDLGRAASAGAYAASLRRLCCGDLCVDDAVSPEILSPERLRLGGQGVLTLDEALSFLPVHQVDEREAVIASNGGNLREAPPGRFRVRGPGGLLGVFEGRAGMARPLVVFSKVSER